MADNQEYRREIDPEFDNPEFAAADRQEEEDVEARSTLVELPPGPWRSLGRHLDYSMWPERERFVRLDRELQRRRRQQ